MGSGKAVPHVRLHIVLVNTVAKFVEHAEAALSVGIAGAGQPVETRCFLGGFGVEVSVVVKYSVAGWAINLQENTCLHPKREHKHEA